MTLRQKQSRFCQLIADLIHHAAASGYELTWGEAYRSKEEAARLASLGLGIKTSLHTQRLAVDLNLFLDGVYQTTTEAYRPLGEWWEQQSGEGYTCCWGGRFKDSQGRPKPDGNHFSISHGGRQ